MAITLQGKEGACPFKYETLLLRLSALLIENSMWSNNNVFACAIPISVSLFFKQRNFREAQEKVLESH